VDRKHQLIVVMAVLILSLGASTVLAEEQPKATPPPPPVQSLANDGFLYVLVGQSIHQYQLPDMTFQKTVTLPGARDSRTVDAGSRRPPILSFLIDREFLYIVGARYMYQYSLPDLDLQVTQSLPKLPDSQ
jgi:hypothetical protein